MERIAVIGAGTMGRGIATSFALGGCQVCLYDPIASAREACIPHMKNDMDFMREMEVISERDVEIAIGRIQVYDELASAVRDAELVIESAPEDLRLKQDLFEQMDALCLPSCIFASNTSSLKLKDMMAKLSPARKECTMICHFYNPAHLLPIVELSYYGNMPKETFQKVYALFESIGKKPVKVDKDVPGLIANRIQNAMAREAYALMESGVAAPEEIERAMLYGPCFRYATTGQREITDMGGIDVWTAVADTLWGDLESRSDAGDILRQKVNEGKLGLKSGEGFFRYDTPARREEAVRDFHKRLMIQLKASRQYETMTGGSGR